MSVHERPDADDDPTFIYDGRRIFLRCVTGDGVHMGDLMIAEAVLESHAMTLVNAANAGMQYIRDHNLNLGLRDLLDGEQ